MRVRAGLSARVRMLLCALRIEYRFKRHSTAPASFEWAFARAIALASPARFTNSVPSLTHARHEKKRFCIHSCTVCRDAVLIVMSECHKVRDDVGRSKQGAMWYSAKLPEARWAQTRHDVRRHTRASSLIPTPDLRFHRL